jgi:N utilization substance protein B
MIKRRSVRIKVLQAAYGFEHGDGLPLDHYMKDLRLRIRSVRDIFCYNLLVIQSLAEAVEHDADNRASKHLQTEEDLRFNTKFLGNTFIQYLASDAEYNEIVKQSGLRDLLDDALTSNWYNDLREYDAYKHYLSSSREFDPVTDLELIRQIYRNILLTNEDFHLHIQDLFSNWIDDAEFISTSVLQCLDKSKNKLSLPFQKESYNAKMDELIEFGCDLLRHTVNGKEQQLELISTKLQNWDIERLASTDIIILRMALAELINFPSIPTKVTINEYIDIAREYSTPRSKDFVNGILDNLTKELKDKGVIHKEGRGLKES